MRTLNVRLCRLAPWFLLFFACTPLRDLDGAGAGYSASGQSGSAGAAGYISNGSSGGSGGSTITAGQPSSGMAGGGGVGAAFGGNAMNPVAGAAGQLTSGGAHSTSGGRESAGGSQGGGLLGGSPNAGTAQGGDSHAGQAPAQTGGGQAGGAHGGNTQAGNTSAPQGGANASGAPNGGKSSSGGGGGLPDLQDIPDFPITGKLAVSDESFWNVNGKATQTFEIKSPVAEYTILPATASLVSIEDATGKQWIAYNDFRPKRGLPALGSCCENGNPEALGLPAMTTVWDRENFTNTHARFVSRSSSGDIHLVWDAYLTHLTITIHSLKTPYGFTYRGVPGGEPLEANDQLRLPTGTIRNANNAWNGDLPGPVEWVYFTDPALAQSFFLIRHGDDDLAETYQVADQDTARFVFSGGQSSAVPARFSIGMVPSTDHAKVVERVNFVIGNTP